MEATLFGAGTLARTIPMVSALALAAASTSPAHAQSETQAESGQANSPDPGEQEILVTGSRIARHGFDAPSPVTVLNAEDINNLGLTNVADVVAQLPQNSQFTTPTNVGAGNFNIGASLANLRGLNPFFGTRTLTLVDTRRIVPTTDGGAVDLNVIPSQLIARVETVTGGASAAYGSDAVAGVVNLILDTRLQGFKGQVDYGITSEGDGEEVHASLAFGTGFAGGRGRFIIGGEYQQSDDVGGCGQVRDWCAGPDGGYNLFTNSNYTSYTLGPPAFPGGPPSQIPIPGTQGNPALPGFGLPHYLLLPNARAFSSRTGLFQNLAQQFDATGTTLVPYEVGNYASAFGGMQGGADETQDFYRNSALRPQVEHYSLFGHGEYDIAESLIAFVEGGYYRNDATNLQVQDAGTAFGPQIQADNVFVPVQYRPGGANNIFPANPFFPFFGGPFAAQAFASDGALLPPRINNTVTESYRGAIGVKGDLSSTWSFDAYYTYGRTDTKTRVHNSQVNTFFANAVDAVAGAGGTPACRINVDANPANDDPACAPLNLFGLNGENGYDNSAGFAYAYRTLFQDVKYQQHVAAASVNGDLFDGWGAGPIGFAAGVDFRNESILTTHNIEEQPFYQSYGRGYGAPYRGKMDIFEGFAEVNVPVLADVPFFQNLSFNGAVRQTRNKTTGASGDIASGDIPALVSNSVDFTTWKINGIWDVNEWVRFRATRSRDVRAPSFFELYGQSIQNGGFFGTVNNPQIGPDPNTNQDAAVVRLGGSDASLGPEKADTTTAGLVFTGHGALSGFRASVDWYQVKLNGPISTPGAGNIVTTCFNLGGPLCDLLDGTGRVDGTGPTGAGTGFADITDIFNFDLNLGRYTTRGLDMEASYYLRLDADNSLSFRVIGAYLYDLVIDPGTGVPVRNYAGISGPTGAFGYFNTAPKWQGNAFVTFARQRFTGTVQARYVGPGKFALLDGQSQTPYVAPGDAGYDPTLVNSINDNSVPSRVYVNLSASYRLPLGNGGADDDNIELFGVINNLFGREPPVAPGGNGFPTNPVYFDTMGTSFRFGTRFQF